VKFFVSSCVLAVTTCCAIPVVSAESQADLLIGKWCLNTEVYDGEVTVDGSTWTFNSDGTYAHNQAYDYTGSYSLSEGTIQLQDFGQLQIRSISDSELTGEFYSTYHFTRNSCLPIVAEAARTTKLNNAISMGNLAEVRAIVESGVDINQPDTRSSMRSTPLMVAARFGTEETIKYLLSQNPDLSVENYLGSTALDIAEKAERHSIANLIKGTIMQSSRAFKSNGGG